MRASCRILALCTILRWLLLPFAAHAAVAGNGDIQLWTRSYFDGPISRQWDWQFVFETRWGNDASTLYYWYLQPQLFYQPAEWISIEPGYRQGFSKHLISDNWVLEYAPLLDVVLMKTVAEWSFSDRSRWQYSQVGSVPWHWLYRNRFRIVSPPIVRSPLIWLFTDNEIFWREKRGINQDRLSFGTMILLNETVGGELFYMDRFWKRAPGWIYQTVFNVRLDLFF